MAIRPEIACQTPAMIIITAANRVKPTAQPAGSTLWPADRDCEPPSVTDVSSSLWSPAQPPSTGGVRCTVGTTLAPGLRPDLLRLGWGCAGRRFRPGAGAGGAC